MIDFSKLLDETDVERAARKAARAERWAKIEADRLAEKVAPRNSVFSITGEVVEVGTWGTDSEGHHWTAVYVVPDSPLRAQDGCPHLRVMVLTEALPDLAAAIEARRIAAGVRVTVQGDLRRNRGATCMYAQAIIVDA